MQWNEGNVNPNFVIPISDIQGGFLGHYFRWYRTFENSFHIKAVDAQNAHILKILYAMQSISEKGAKIKVYFFTLNYTFLLAGGMHLETLHMHLKLFCS